MARFKLPRFSKYSARRTEVDGITFASKAEATRYSELKLLEKAGKITDLVLQPRFELSLIHSDGTRGQLIGSYVADFQYRDEAGVLVIEDVKGMKTPLYRWKKKHFETQYGLKITEIERR